jgi:hypothetical protein
MAKLNLQILIFLFSLSTVYMAFGEPCNVAGTANPISGFLAEGQAAIINLSGNSPSTTAIQWQTSADLVNWTDIPGATNASYTTPVLTSGIYYYRATVTAGCTSNTLPATVLVGPGFMAGYCYRKTITVDPGQVTGTLTNYPMLVSLTDNDLRTVANGGFVASANAHDIRFTDFNGVELNRQIERYDPQTGELIAWVRIPALSATNPTILYIYFGNAAAVAPAAAFVNGTWDAGYRGIWHLDATDAANVLNDATTFGNNAQEGAAGATFRIPGKIGSGRSFTGVNGSNSFLRVPNHPSFDDDVQDQVTLEAWARNLQPATDDAPYLLLSPNTNRERYMLGVDGGSTQVNRRVTTTTGHYRYDSPVTLADTWNHYVMVYNAADGGVLNVYVNGQLVLTNTAPSGNILNSFDGDGGLRRDLLMGARPPWVPDNRRYKGVLDELRVSNVARSPEWIATQYNNHNSPGTFYTVGPLSFIDQPGVATAFDELLDEEESTTLNLTGFAAGGSIQWQQSPDGVNFTDIGGATAATYETPLLTSTTFYRAKVNFGACDAFSNVLEVVVREAFFAEPPVVYTFRREITIDYTKVSGSNDLTNFPMLVSLTDAELRTTANGGKVRDANGWDIIFTNEQGVKLDHELERYVATTGTLVAWVKIPTLKATSNTIIYMYYGACGVTLTNPSTTATFNNNYTGVYHLNDATATDSSPNGNNGNELGGINATNITAGQIGNATQVNGGDQRFQFTGVNNPQIAGGNPRTVQLWARVNNFGGDNRGLFQAGTDANDFSIRIRNVNNNFRIGVAGNAPEFTLGGALAQWRMYHLVYAGGTNPVRIYYDGELFDVIGLGAALNTPVANLLLGRRGGNSIQGALDEFRISSVARSSDWIKTEYNNQRDPASFYTLGPQTAEYVWTGLSADANTDWADAENWSGCEVPIPGADIRIPDIHPRTNYPLLDQAREIGFIRIGPDDANFTPVPSVDANGNPLTIRGNLRNDGLVTGTTGSYVLAGNRNQRQRISGIGVSEFPNLTLNNPRGAFLAKNIGVASQLGFTNGHLSLFNFDLQLDSGATITGADANKFIVTNGTGGVCWAGIGHATTLFPIGTRTESYTPFEVTNQGTQAGFCIRVCENVHEDGTCAGTQIDQEVVHRTWQVTPTTQTGLDLTLTAHWTAPLQSGDFDPTNVYMSRYVTGGWERISTFQDASTSFTTTASGLSHFPYATMSFAIGSNGSMLLPVTYLYFRGEHVAGVNRLHWETAQERNNAFFEVQRSANGQVFETVGILLGSGERNQPGTYQYLDAKPLPGTNYYRLKQTDRDGNTNYSQVIAIQVERNQGIWVYPNPVNTGILYLVPHGTDAAAPFTYRLYSIAGAVVRMGTIPAGNHAPVQLDVRQLPKGIYIVEAQQGNQVAREKLRID